MGISQFLYGLHEAISCYISKEGFFLLLLIHSPATSVYLVVPFPSSVVTAPHSFVTVISEDVIATKIPIIPQIIPMNIPLKMSLNSH